MKEKLKGIKLDVTLSAVLTVVLGIVFLVWPGEVLTGLAKIIAIVLIIGGIATLLYQLFSSTKNAIFMVLAAIVALIGFWMLLRPTTVASIIPIIIGVVLIAHGIQDVAMAFEGKKNEAARWGMILLAAVLSIVLGIVCIYFAFKVVSSVTRIIGIMLIYDGVSDMVIVHKVNKADKIIDGELKHEEDVDDDFDDFV